MTDKKAATIDVRGGVVTLINVYEVEPDRQAELVRLLEEATETVMRHQPGFISVSIHSSFDGARVVNYAQWASKEDFERLMKNSEAQAQMKTFAATARSVAPALYRVSSVHV
ncbi:antibiotic biosynthesis monooxygenase [Nitrobacter winogradskyi Nb-255]|uniref:Antibiotic biosynthesis monooxygenase n=1 Tax=Nitrobacter winogradskyi (strain ATCC 25391 / DSM 10237 / CIP 104748 / NCIMB 11846 / Nb-255) TaxID=323098 RepID=Q3SQP8_NITWN|nr:antibiotic biosynthesis monooxygenase family protein [Nitrobacter winogradskyi]ABA05393.1 antibiotic biosynthesis monooxygenase [Nitrobacter winogradskyi Nb-255]